MNASLSEPTEVDFVTLREAVGALAESTSGAFVFYTADEPVRVSHAELGRRALIAAGGLSARGVGPGETVGILGRNRPEWVVGAAASWLLGAAVVPLQIPLRIRDPQAFSEQATALARAAECRVVLADEAFVDAIPREVGVQWDELGSVPIERLPNDPGPDVPAVIQFTSGSTASPKGAVITSRAALVQMQTIQGVWERARREACSMRPLGWVPFFHDLGLFLYLCYPIVYRTEAHLLPTETFARNPVEWLRLVETTRANFTVAPPSAWGAAISAALHFNVELDLSSLDGAFLAAEPVDPDVVDRVIEVGCQHGLREGAVGVAYGLAEAVLTVTTTRSEEGVDVDVVDLPALAAEGVARPAEGVPAKRIASCGRPEPGTEIRIVSRGEDVGERRTGEVWVRSPSLMSGYLGATQQPFADGWLRTGDLGYLSDGKLYVTGRMKDVVIVLGHNYYPEDFEWAASRVEGVRGGRCVAIARPESESVVLIVEPRRVPDLDDLALRIKRAVTDAIGIAPAEVVVVPRGTIELTSSGKLRRTATRGAYEQGKLETVGKA